jgi:hypothetical protein
LPSSACSLLSSFSAKFVRLAEGVELLLASALEVRVVQVAEEPRSPVPLLMWVLMGVP